MAREMNIGNRIGPPRFLLFLAILAAGYAASMTMLTRPQAMMVSFDFAALLFLLGCLPLFRRHAQDMRKAALENDANRVILLIVTVVLSMVILVTVAGELIGPHHPAPIEKLMIILTLILAWLFANTVYALHYAHLFYSRDDGGKDLAGLIFPGERAEPDYSDFVYFSFTLGIALQTSDVAITSPGIRRIVIGQCIAAFVYNIVVLALAVSVLASR
ncbi:DUF1345 domain-containing protein [Sphingomonas sp. RB56-2]|uniref:DUF1345 domain-containing protein n=1 Tax=Sphingomonas brevis TaxID=2908206 RepID=A0ABT0SAU3_9SPHN|nr:DUF1345 domain-containing protein [Sphingomonas brevis]MCL6741498.1 DUF1345 domain-containing protein [Sphingomonas brevis]